MERQQLFAYLKMYPLQARRRAKVAISRDQDSCVKPFMKRLFGNLDSNIDVGHLLVMDLTGLAAVIAAYWAGGEFAVIKRQARVTV